MVIKLQFQSQAKNLSFFKDSRDFSKGEKNSGCFKGFKEFKGCWPPCYVGLGHCRKNPNRGEGGEDILSLKTPWKF